MSRLQQVRKASRTQLKARVALDGPTGAGKTWTALEWAMALQSGEGRTVVIDTEGGSAEWYSDKWSYSVVPWAPPYNPGELADTIRDAQTQYDVVIVDSISHFWEGEGGTLDMVDAAAQRANGNSYAGWKVGTPALRRLVDTILQSTCHVVVTMRSKMEYVLEKDPKTGKQAPKKVGMSPVMRAGVEYEFTLIGDLDLEHRLTITKSRCSALDSQVFQAGRAGEAAEQFLGWLNDGESQTEAAAEYVKTALDPSSSVDHLRAAHAEAQQRNLLAAPVTDEAGQASTLGDLLIQRGNAAKATAEAAMSQPPAATQADDGAGPEGDRAAGGTNGTNPAPVPSSETDDPAELTDTATSSEEGSGSGGEDTNTTTPTPGDAGDAGPEPTATKTKPKKTTTKKKAPAKKAEGESEDQPVGAATLKMRHMFGLFNEQGITDEADQYAGIAKVIGREIKSRSELSLDEYDQVIDSLEARKQSAGVAA